jgi:ankyrin repeat protein
MMLTTKEQNFLTAAKEGNFEEIKTIFSQNEKINLNVKDAMGNTALILAAEKGDLDIMEFLLQKGISLQEKNFLDNNVLHVLARLGNVKAIRALKNYTAFNPNFRN